MKVLQAWNPVWANVQQTAILLSVNFEELPENEVPFVTRADDPMEHGVDLWYAAIAGDFGPIGDYEAPPVIVTVPEEISTRQFLIAAALNGIITQQEAIDAATNGAVPSAIEAVFSQLPPDQAFGARITWAKMTIIPRIDPLVTAVGQMFSMTNEQLDQFFIQAAAI